MEQANDVLVTPADNPPRGDLGLLLDVLAEIAIAATQRTDDGEGRLRLAS